MEDKTDLIRRNVARLLAGKTLQREEMEEHFATLLKGSSENEILLTATLSALRVRGEQACELAGAVDALNSAIENPIKASEGVIDIVGTGGDGLGTFNISSASALVVASCGVSVAKHGNRAVSSPCGSADVFEALGVNINAPFNRIQQCLDNTKFCFMFAPRHHPAMAFAAKVRKELRSPTIFNMLGPLLNPAGVQKGLFGVINARIASLYAEVLELLNFKQAWIVNGAGGADEMTLSGESQAIILQGNNAAGMHKKRALLPADAKLEERKLDLIRGGDAQYNARAIMKVINNRCGSSNSPEQALFETIVYNSAAALMLAGRAQSLLEGANIAREALTRGDTKKTLEKVKAITNS